MKAEELRVGNYLDRNGLMQVLGIGSNNKLVIFDHYNNQKLPYGLEIDSFKGIPLTPEWLERAGFVKITNDCPSEGDWYWSRPKFPGCIGFKDLAYSIVPFNRITTVHSLQNLYFALTGEELTIK